MEKSIPCNGNQKKAGVAILVSDKIVVKIKTVTRDKQEHYIMIKRSIQEEDTTIVNKYTSNTAFALYIEVLLTVIKGEIDNNTIIVGDFNTQLSSMYTSSRQEINKETEP